jgi:hypothetical protein
MIKILPAKPVSRFLMIGFIATALAACSNTREVVDGGGLGIAATLSACPTVAIPEYTGDVTLFNPPENRTAEAIDVVANITNVRSTCDDTSDQIYTNATFDVFARRSDNRGARSVQLPYFSTVVRGGTSVVAKRVGAVTLNFADGSYRAQASGTAGGYVNKAAATLPEDIQERITRRRKSGDADAAIDPLSQPDVKAALLRTSFELLIGFQLTGDQLRYNATR